jgi:hypothetical protein
MQRSAGSDCNYFDFHLSPHGRCTEFAEQRPYFINRDIQLSEIKE